MRMNAPLMAVTRDPWPAVPPRVAAGGTQTLSAKGEPIQRHAIVPSPDGSRRDLPPDATWTSNNRAVASVSATGLVTAVNDGRAMVAASVRGLSDAKILI